MRKILAITSKEIYTVFRDRNLILLMFATPLVLSTIIGLAFGSTGDSEVPDFADIPVAVVNHDEGVDLQETIDLPDQFANLDALPFDLEDFGLPPNLSAIGQNPLLQNGSELNFGDILAGILLSQPITDTATLGGIEFDVAQFECTLLDPSAEAGAASFAAEGSLSDLLDATAVQDAEQARAAVDSGEFAAAVIIPPGFSRRMVPQFAFDEGGRLYTQPVDESGSVEVYANNGRPISSRILHSIVTGTRQSVRARQRRAQRHPGNVRQYAGGQFCSRRHRSQRR